MLRACEAEVAARSKVVLVILPTSQQLQAKASQFRLLGERDIKSRYSGCIGSAEVVLSEASSHGAGYQMRLRVHHLEPLFRCQSLVVLKAPLLV